MNQEVFVPFDMHPGLDTDSFLNAFFEWQVEGYFPKR